MAVEGYDFAGWASRNNLKCGDGRIIRKDAFVAQDGETVPLCWNHIHDDPTKILGHAILENRDEGLYTYGFLNDSPAGKAMKESLRHGDVKSMSIWATNLNQVGPDVLHGVVRDVSLVVAGRNPGAFIESVLIHGMPMEDGDEDGILYTGDDILLNTQIEESNDIQHAENEKKEEEKSMADEEKKEEGKTVGEIYDSLNKEQKDAVAIIVGQAIADAKGESDEVKKEGGKEEMQHSVFDNEDQQEKTYLSHAEQEEIFKEAKRIGSLRDAIRANLEEGEILCHSIDKTGMTVATGTKDYFLNDANMLFPDYKSLNNPPEFISRNMDWVEDVMSSVHHTPFSRIKSVFADITEDDARAKGYITGNKKKTEVFTTLKRTSDPTTIYKLQKADRDTILDISEFDVVAWIRSEMRMMLNEEIARAILLGDGRDTDSDDHIKTDCVRPVVTDVPLFNVTVIVTVDANATEAEIAKATVDAIIRSRKRYKGSGNPKFYTTDDVLTEMLMLENKNGDKVYKTEAEITTTLRVQKIVPVEPMSGYKVTVGSGSTAKSLELIGCMVNLRDYNVGTDRGGEINNFEDFDIDFNKYAYLIETRMSGALVRPFSAVTFLLEKKAATGGSKTSSGSDQ